MPRVGFSQPNRPFFTPRRPARAQRCARVRAQAMSRHLQRCVSQRRLSFYCVLARVVCEQPARPLTANGPFFFFFLFLPAQAARAMYARARKNGTACARGVSNAALFVFFRRASSVRRFAFVYELTSTSFFLSFPLSPAGAQVTPRATLPRLCRAAQSTQGDVVFCGCLLRRAAVGVVPL